MCQYFRGLGGNSPCCQKKEGGELRRGATPTGGPRQRPYPAPEGLCMMLRLARF